MILESRRKNKIHENEQQDLGKFDDYAIGVFKEKGFTRVSDKEYKHPKEGLVAKYKSFPGNKYGGFTLFKNGKELYSKPADECWSRLYDYFEK